MGYENYTCIWWTSNARFPHCIIICLASWYRYSKKLYYRFLTMWSLSLWGFSLLPASLHQVLWPRRLTVQLWFSTVQLWFFTVQLWFFTQFTCDFSQFSCDFSHSSVVCFCTRERLELNLRAQRLLGHLTSSRHFETRVVRARLFCFSRWML